jgi:Fe2+ transport system protein FeoA
MLLSFLKRGEKGIITDIAHPTLRIEALRFGICIGQSIECCEVIPSGPVIVKKGNQEIAIGRQLANYITIKNLSE